MEVLNNTGLAIGYKQEHDIDYEETFFSSCQNYHYLHSHFCSCCLLLATISNGCKKWPSFRKIYMPLPLALPHPAHYFRRLCHALFGLRQAPMLGLNASALSFSVLAILKVFMTSFLLYQMWSNAPS